jgi:hypothetical protein
VPLGGEGGQLHDPAALTPVTTVLETICVSKSVWVLYSRQHFVLVPAGNRIPLVRSEVFTAVTMKNVVFWDIRNPVRTSQETHYVSATEPSLLMLCKIRGVHGGHYEGYRLLGYKNPVRTSQETHHVCATESSRLKLSKI